MRASLLVTKTRRQWAFSFDRDEMTFINAMAKSSGKPVAEFLVDTMEIGFGLQAIGGLITISGKAVEDANKKVPKV